jgi:large subunit ribosomal protein L9
VAATVAINVARSAAEAERQAVGEVITVVEQTTMEDLGLEVGAALADAGGRFGER